MVRFVAIREDHAGGVGPEQLASRSRRREMAEESGGRFTATVSPWTCCAFLALVGTEDGFPPQSDRGSEGLSSSSRQ